MQVFLYQNFLVLHSWSMWTTSTRNIFLETKNVWSTWPKIKMKFRNLICLRQEFPCNMASFCKNVCRFTTAGVVKWPLKQISYVSVLCIEKCSEIFRVPKVISGLHGNLETVRNEHFRERCVLVPDTIVLPNYSEWSSILGDVLEHSSSNLSLQLQNKCPGTVQNLFF